MRPIVPPPVIALAMVLAMYIVSKTGNFLPFDFPGQNAAAFIVAFLGLLLDALCVAAFFRAKTTVSPLKPERTQKLVVEGFYRFSRNPMYLGMLIILVGAFISLGEGVNFVFVALFVLLLNELQIKPEERVLEEKFGNDYRIYKKRVRRWI